MSPFMNINEAFSNRSICHWSVFPTQSFPLLCSQAALLSTVFCNHHFPNAFYKSPCNFHWKKNGFALSMVVVAWVCWGDGGVLVWRQYKVALNCLVGVTQWAARCSLEQVENQKRMFANLFWTMFKSKEVRESGVRWKWVTIYACTQWLGSERQMQRCSGNPNWLSAGPKLLEGKGPLLLGLAFLTLSFTSLSSTWVASEKSLGPECLGQRHRINIDFKLLKNLELGPGVCLLPSVSSRTSTFTQQAKHISGPLFIDYSFENLPAP